MNFIMQIDEQILLLFEGAMGFHCDRKKEKKMPYMCFKKNIELNLNSFLVFSPFHHQLLGRAAQHCGEGYKVHAFGIFCQRYGVAGGLWGQFLAQHLAS